MLHPTLAKSLNTFVYSSSGIVAALQPLQRLGQNVCNVVLIADAFQVDYPLAYKVSDLVVYNVDVLGSLVGYQVARHVHCPLVVHADRYGCYDLYKLAKEEIDVQTVLACINVRVRE